MDEREIRQEAMKEIEKQKEIVSRVRSKNRQAMQLLKEMGAEEPEINQKINKEMEKLLEKKKCLKEYNPFKLSSKLLKMYRKSINDSREKLQKAGNETTKKQNKINEDLDKPSYMVPYLMDMASSELQLPVPDIQKIKLYMENINKMVSQSTISADEADKYIKTMINESYKIFFNMEKSLDIMEDNFETAKEMII